MKEKKGYMKHFLDMCYDVDKQFKAGDIDCPHITQDWIDGCITTIEFLIEEGF